MNYSTVLTVFLISLSSYQSFAQEVEVVKFDEIVKILENDTDKVKVVNFWATWCGPCVRELPNFEAINKKYSNVEVILVNLDFVEGLDKVKHFVAKKELKSKVILLDEIDYNTWIDKVSPEWSGAIPSTIIISPLASHKKFLEGELTAYELESELQLFL